MTDTSNLGLGAVVINTAGERLILTDPGSDYPWWNVVLGRWQDAPTISEILQPGLDANDDTPGQR